MGPQGATCLTGATWPQGIQGLTGPQGNDGPIGIQCPIGITGLQSSIGATCPQGLTGVTGPQGESCISGTITQSLIPNLNQAYDLGTESFKFNSLYIKDVYASDNYVHIGSNVITSNNDNLILPSNTIVGNSDPIGTIYLYGQKPIKGNYKNSSQFIIVSPV